MWFPNLNIKKIILFLVSTSVKWSIYRHARKKELYGEVFRGLGCMCQYWLQTYNRNLFKFRYFTQQMCRAFITHGLLVTIVFMMCMMTSEGCGRQGPRLSGEALEECRNNCARTHNIRQCQGRSSAKGVRMCVRRINSDYHNCLSAGC